MAMTSIYGANAAALPGSPVQRLLLATDLGDGTPADERVLQELCALEGSEGRRRQQRRQRWRAARHRGLRLSDGFPIELEAPARASAGLSRADGTVPAGPGENLPTAGSWLGDLDVHAIGR